MTLKPDPGTGPRRPVSHGASRAGRGRRAPRDLRFLPPADAGVVVPAFNDAYLREVLPPELYERFTDSADQAAGP